MVVMRLGFIDEATELEEMGGGVGDEETLLRVKLEKLVEAQDWDR